MSDPAPLLPWHGPPWQRLHTMLEADRVHHALLLCGPSGLGKQVFADRAALALLCETTGEGMQRPCGRCRSCRLGAAGTHPDRLDIRPEEGKRIIGVDQVRARLAELVLTPHYAHRRVALVSPAEALNRHAADALLKTLEEPTSAVVFLLVSSRPSSLPVTVRSRCLRLPFDTASDAEGLQWIEQQGVGGPDAAMVLAWCAGAPLAAVTALEQGLAAAVAEIGGDVEALLQGKAGVVAVAERWRKVGLAPMVEWQLRIVTALMRRAVGADDGAGRLATKHITRTLDLGGLNTLCEELLELRAAGQRQLNPNEQLGLEHLTARWAALSSR